MSQSSDTTLTVFPTLLSLTSHLQDRPIIYIIGAGSKTQLNSSDLAVQLPRVAALVASTAPSASLPPVVLYGGDPFNEDKADVATVVQSLDKVEVIAVQTARYRKYTERGTDSTHAHVSTAYFFPDEPDPTGRTKSLNGGYVRDRDLQLGEPAVPAGTTGVVCELVSRGVELAHVVVVGGGSIAADEVHVLVGRGVPVTCFPVRTVNPYKDSDLDEAVEFLKQLVPADVSVSPEAVAEWGPAAVLARALAASASKLTVVEPTSEE